jgi:hypothetical protein
VRGGLRETDGGNAEPHPRAYLTDGGAGGGLVDNLLPGGAGGDERGNGQVVDGAGLAAGGLTDLGDGVV